MSYQAERNTLLNNKGFSHQLVTRSQYEEWPGHEEQHVKDGLARRICLYVLFIENVFLFLEISGRYVQLVINTDLWYRAGIKETN